MSFETSLLGVQYAVLSFYMNYYKSTIISKNKIDILEVLNSSDVCPDLTRILRSEYRSNTGKSDSDVVNMLVSTGPFSVIDGSGKLISSYNPIRRKEGVSTVIECTQDAVNIQLIDFGKKQVIDKKTYKKKDYWFVPFVSIYSACEVIRQLCSKYNKNGIKIRTKRKVYIISGIAGNEEIRDILSGDLLLREVGNNDVLRVNILEIEEVVRL